MILAIRKVVFSRPAHALKIPAIILFITVGISASVYVQFAWTRRHLDEIYSCIIDDGV